VNFYLSLTTELFIEKSPDSAIIKKSLSCPNELHIIEEIGRGGFGCVSKAIWRGSIVAAKEVPTAGNAKVLENELAVYRSLNHPNLLSLLGTMQRPQSLVLIMNYVRGQSLHNVIFGDGPQLDYAKKVRISVQIVQGLVFMHTSEPPVVHLDMKPENVLVEDDTGHVFLADFGLGRLLTKTRVFGTATKIAGTPGFQAPEKLRGEKITTLVDIYAWVAYSSVESRCMITWTHTPLCFKLE
jgi:serine/threonine protein kinase